MFSLNASITSLVILMWWEPGMHIIYVLLLNFNLVNVMRFFCWDFINCFSFGTVRWPTYEW